MLAFRFSSGLGRSFLSSLSRSFLSRGLLGGGGSFGLSPLGTQAFLVLLVFLGLAYSIMRFMLGLFDQGERLLNRGRHLRKRR